MPGKREGGRYFDNNRQSEGEGEFQCHWASEKSMREGVGQAGGKMSWKLRRMIKKIRSPFFNVKKECFNVNHKINN